MLRQSDDPLAHYRNPCGRVKALSHTAFFFRMTLDLARRNKKTHPTAAKTTR